VAAAPGLLKCREAAACRYGIKLLDLLALTKVKQNLPP